MLVHPLAEVWGQYLWREPQGFFSSLNGKTRRNVTWKATLRLCKWARKKDFYCCFLRLVSSLYPVGHLSLLSFCSCFPHEISVTGVSTCRRGSFSFRTQFVKFLWGFREWNFQIWFYWQAWKYNPRLCFIPKASCREAKVVLSESEARICIRVVWSQWKASSCVLPL